MGNAALEINIPDPDLEHYVASGTRHPQAGTKQDTLNFCKPDAVAMWPIHGTCCKKAEVIAAQYFGTDMFTSAMARQSW